MKLPILPIYYYHDHFTEMLSFVTETYGAVLTERHSKFTATFNALSKDAQCLLIRMINRRGRVFRHAAFRYHEIGDPVRALAELTACGQIQPLGEDDYAAFIVCLPKDALIKGGRSAGFTDIRTSWPKAKLVEYFLSRVPFNTAHEYCGGGEFIALGDTEPVEFLLYLYFGKTEDDLKNFALRDLGILRTNKDANLSARFTDGEEARACFHYSRLLDHLELKSEAFIARRSYPSSAGPLARPITPLNCAAALRTRPGFTLRKMMRRSWRPSSIAVARPLNATNAWCVFCMLQATEMERKNFFVE
jgi:DNA polymerase-3 subunit epsilon